MSLSCFFSRKTRAQNFRPFFSKIHFCPQSPPLETNDLDQTPPTCSLVCAQHFGTSLIPML
jgi:hypothetical protein